MHNTQDENHLNKTLSKAGQEPRWLRPSSCIQRDCKNGMSSKGCDLCYALKAASPRDLHMHPQQSLLTNETVEALHLLHESWTTTQLL